MPYKKTFLLLLVSLAVSLLLSPGTASALDICKGINEAIGQGQVDVLDCGKEDVVSFIGFEGGLQAPTGEGLDTTLTRAKTAREFIVNTVNFVLTFLGIIAVAIVIYGGFLYVTAAGNEEQSTKGKKSITYAVIGILIIIASFALVNTLLTFGGGKTTDRGAPGAGPGGSAGTRGVGEEGSNIGQQIIYNLGAAEINASLNDFVSAYKNLVTIDGLLEKLKQLPAPTDRQENRNYVAEVSNIITEIKNSAHALSKTRQISQRMLDEYLFGLQAISPEALAKKYPVPVHTEGDSGGSFGEPIASKLQEEVLTKLGLGGVGVLRQALGGGASGGAEFDILQASKDDFTNTINLLIGSSASPIIDQPIKDIQGRILIVWKIMGAVAKETNVAQAVQRNLISEKDLRRAFAGIDPNVTVQQLFVETITNIHEARQLTKDPGNTELLVEAVRSLDRLHVVIKDIKFTFVKIRASVREGSAPLIVELNGLDSRDPTGQTIADDNYLWDPDGDGKEGPPTGGGAFAPVSCNRPNGPTITCTYNHPGTYIVRLSIASKDPTHIASGQAFLPITVGPSVARIGLKASVGAISEELRAYDKDARDLWALVLDKNEFHVTTEEAKTAGITFDASNSQGGNEQPLKLFSWSFGDGTQPEEGPSKNKIERHLYKREGKFTLKLEVTDTGNRKDRKIMNILVASLAARIGTKQTMSEPDSLMEFDGSLSRSDNGSISSYKWSLLDKDGADITTFQNAVSIIGDPTGAVLRVKFKKPGVYSIRLGISDGSGTDQAEVPISIKSRKPRANFTIRSCPGSCPDPSQPSIVELDAGMSFDPDKGDVLSYNWEFFNEVGDKLEPKTGFNLNPATTPLSGQQAKKLRVKFLSTGKFKAVLRLNDSHTDPNILQEDIREKEIEITSIVEAKWNPGFNPVIKLKDGKASFDFLGTIEKHNRQSIDFGDGTTLDCSVTCSGSNAALGLLFSHEYTKAGSYLVTVTAASDEGKGENKMAKRVYVAGGDEPLAVMEVLVDEVPITLPEPTQDTTKPALEMIRNKVITFDASRSIDSNGKTGTAVLQYSWDFGDKRPSTGPVVQHAYTDLSPDSLPFTVTLTVTEKGGEAKQSQALFYVKVLSKKPQINTISLEKKTPGQVTPIEVELTAEGADDPDGDITNYQFWYYDPADKEKKLSVIDTHNETALLTVETNGAENEEREYYFCATLTDNENSISECSELFQERELPRLKVKNGPNQAPVASFSVDRTSVKVNETITFTSSSVDPDGRITQYIWDLDGDGFQNDKPTELATITHNYERKSSASGYRVKLKVIDDKNAAGFSKEIAVKVDPLSKAPVANFTYSVDPLIQRRVKFFGDATLDPDVTDRALTITKWKWDFDTSQEFSCSQDPKPASCNSNKTDDEDSTDQNPIFDYPLSGNYQVRLTIEDSDFNTAEKTGRVSLIAGSAGGTGTSSPLAKILKADLKLKTDAKTTYQFEMVQGQKRKVLRVPANANGQTVTLFWGDSRGNIEKYTVDKNIWCDSNGDGTPYNDEDNPDSKVGNCNDISTGLTADHCWTTNYQRFTKPGQKNPFGPGHFTTRLTVTGPGGKVDTDSVEIVFDGVTDPKKVLSASYDCDGKPASLGGASLFQRLGIQNTILLSVLSGVIVVLIGFSATSFLRRGKRREL